MALRRVTPEEALRLGLLDGKPGIQGEQGIQGPEGPPGRPGLDGMPGVSIRGERGERGQDGRDGVDGVDAVGTPGEKGEKGDIGPVPKHQWRGTSLRFEEAPDEWGKYVDLRGRDGLNSRNTIGGGGSSSGGGSGVTAHADLTGLTADDHTQYLLTNGTRSMTGNLDFNKSDPEIVMGTGQGNDQNHLIIRHDTNFIPTSAFTSFSNGAGNEFLRFAGLGQVDISDGAVTADGQTGATQVGFHETTPIVKPTVTGSRGGNAALASLLTALANYGLITDSSSA